MNNIIRSYNQNRKNIIIWILIIMFIIIMIQLFNYLYKKSDKQTDVNEDINQTEYEKESESIISSGSVSKENRKSYGSLIDDFLSNCVNNNYEQAYEIISNDCKQLYYPTLEEFKELYCKNKFSSKKTYSFQSWTSGETNIYEIKIFDDILSSGIVSTDKYISDYYTVVVENGEKKLNINNYIKRQEINKNVTKNGITIHVESLNIFKEYIIYNFKIVNQTKNRILLDSKEQSDSIYIENSYGIKYVGLLYENLNKELILDAGEEKEISIKFNVIYREGLKLEKICFTDIITNYNESINDIDNNTNKNSIEIEV